MDSLHSRRASALQALYGPCSRRALSRDFRNSCCLLHVDFPCVADPVRSRSVVLGSYRIESVAAYRSTAQPNCSGSEDVRPRAPRASTGTTAISRNKQGPATSLIRWSPEEPIPVLGGYSRNLRDPNQTPTAPTSGLSQRNPGWRPLAVASIIDTSSARGPAAISRRGQGIHHSKHDHQADQNRGGLGIVRHPGRGLPADVPAHEPRLGSCRRR